MQDNQGNQITLQIGGYSIHGWDAVSIDSQIDTPAENWSFKLFQVDGEPLPEDIAGAKDIKVFYNKELVLTSIADKVAEAVSRDGYGLEISGRDLAGQLIDCSVPIFNGRQLTLEALLSQYVLAGDLGSQIHDVRIQNNAWLKNKVSVEPGESLWDAIAKAAAVTGQHVWLEPDGTLVVGDPFAQPYRVQTPLRLMKPLNNSNNVLDLSYVNDVSSVFSEIKILGQDAKGSHVLSSATSNTQYTFNRLKIISMGDVETKSEAYAALEKIKKDNDLQAYSLDATVDGWTIDGKVWTPGWHLNLETNALSNATAKWAVYGRTLMLSRNEGKTVKLRMKRQGDWAQPLLHKEPVKKTSKRKKSKKDSTKAKEAQK
ncbi:phage baseplate assembly protein [Acinetobacter sp.]|uniref:phage baseplate assembly protein n=1 Tax=Acinetobacter sp. TaxID=472 RepID=UPI003D0937F7